MKQGFFFLWIKKWNKIEWFSCLRNDWNMIQWLELENQGLFLKTMVKGFYSIDAFSLHLKLYTRKQNIQDYQINDFLTYFLLKVKLGSFFHCKSLPICNSFVMVRVKFLEIYHHYILPSVPPCERDHLYTLGSESILISTFNSFFKFLFLILF